MFKLQPMRILKYDDDVMLTVNKEDYLKDKENYTSYPWLKSGWTVPFVTGHKYKISWGNNGLDWEQMQVGLSERWAETDKSIYFVHNFTDVRHEYDVTVNGLKKDSANFKNDTIDLLKPSEWQLGNNVLYNMTEVREFHFVVNGKQPEKGKIATSRNMKFVGHRCIGKNCFDEPAPEAECVSEIRSWSNPKDWDVEEDAKKRKE